MVRGIPTRHQRGECKLSKKLLAGLRDVVVYGVPSDPGVASENGIEKTPMRDSLRLQVGVHELGQDDEAERLQSQAGQRVQQEPVLGPAAQQLVEPHVGLGNIEVVPASTCLQKHKAVPDSVEHPAGEGMSLDRQLHGVRLELGAERVDLPGPSRCQTGHGRPLVREDLHEAVIGQAPYRLSESAPRNAEALRQGHFCEGLPGSQLATQYGITHVAQHSLGQCLRPKEPATADGSAVRLLDNQRRYDGRVRRPCQWRFACAHLSSLRHSGDHRPRRAPLRLLRVQARQIGALEDSERSDRRRHPGAGGAADYAAIALAMGCAAVHVERTEDLTNALGQALTGGRPAVGGLCCSRQLVFDTDAETVRRWQADRVELSRQHRVEAAHPAYGRRVAGCLGLYADEPSEQVGVVTDQQAAPGQILAWFVQRWQLEVTFEAARRHLGLETQRQWSDLAIARTTPALLGLFSLVTLLADHHLSRSRVTVPLPTWSRKDHFTFADALALVRRELWADQTFRLSTESTDTVTVSRALIEHLTNTLCYAA